MSLKMNKKELRVFNYKGPVYLFNIEKAKADFQTTATSYEKACCNFIHDSKILLKRSGYGGLSINKKAIKEFYRGKLIIPEELRKEEK